MLLTYWGYKGLPKKAFRCLQGFAGCCHSAFVAVRGRRPRPSFEFGKQSFELRSSFQLRPEFPARRFSSRPRPRGLLGRRRLHARAPGLPATIGRRRGREADGAGPPIPPPPGVPGPPLLRRRPASLLRGISLCKGFPPFARDFPLYGISLCYLLIPIIPFSPPPGGPVALQRAITTLKQPATPQGPLTTVSVRQESARQTYLTSCSDALLAAPCCLHFYIRMHVLCSTP